MRVLALRSTYDYLLAVGPGRSGTTYLYRLLRDHYAVAFPEIKEAGYYRSPDRYRRARRRLPPGTLLGDVDNGAYLDPGLPEAVVRLRGQGQRVLLAVVLRDQVERAECMMRFATSRGRQLRRGGAGALERDVVALDFQRLIREPEALLNGLAGWCGIPAWPEALPRGGVNAGVAARWAPAAALGAALAGGMRRLGLLTALQGLKDSRRVQDLFFRALPAGGGDCAAGTLAPEHVALLRESDRECRDWVEPGPGRAGRLTAAGPARVMGQFATLMITALFPAVVPDAVGLVSWEVAR